MSNDKRPLVAQGGERVCVCVRVCVLILKAYHPPSSAIKVSCVYLPNPHTHTHTHIYIYIYIYDYTILMGIPLNQDVKLCHQCIHYVTLKKGF